MSSGSTQNNANVLGHRYKMLSRNQVLGRHHWFRSRDCTITPDRQKKDSIPFMLVACLGYWILPNDKVH